PGVNDLFVYYDILSMNSARRHDNGSQLTQVLDDTIHVTSVFCFGEWWCHQRHFDAALQCRPDQRLNSRPAVFTEVRSKTKNRIGCRVEVFRESLKERSFIQVLKCVARLSARNAPPCFVSVLVKHSLEAFQFDQL